MNELASILESDFGLLELRSQLMVNVEVNLQPARQPQGNPHIH